MGGGRRHFETEQCARGVRCGGGPPDFLENFRRLMLFLIIIAYNGTFLWAKAAASLLSS